MAPLKRILLAEDSERDVELTLAALEEHNLANEVVVARDGAEALDYLYNRGRFAGHANGFPVLVMLDLKMPKVDGLEVLKAMRSDPYLRHIPVVMITSSREEQDLIRSYQNGVNAYVVKPVDFQRFVESIKQVGFFWAIVNEPPPGAVKRSG
jgi:CheY-like chemotaxis protein